MQPIEPEKFFAELDVLYEDCVGVKPERTNTGNILREALFDLCATDTLERIRTLLKEEGEDVKRVIWEGREDNALYNDSVTLFIYILLLRHTECLIDEWPLLMEVLEPFATDMGVALYR